MPGFGIRFGWGRRRHRATHQGNGHAVGGGTLLGCPVGLEVQVNRLNCQQASGQRLRELGIVEGAWVTVLRRSDPLVLMVKDVRIALDPATAGCIEIEAL